MTINPISPSTSGGISNVGNESVNRSASNVSENGAIPAIQVTEAAIYQKSEPETNKNNIYTRESVTLNAIKQQIEARLGELRAIVENLFSMQNLKTGESNGLNYDQIMEKYNGHLKEFYQNLEVDDATRLKAQQEIAEDGFWGVAQTSARAIEFAKALSGGDPSKIALLRDAIIAGYQAAEDAWGGELPEICQQTQQATLEGLDEWANEALTRE